MMMGVAPPGARAGVGGFVRQGREFAHQQIPFALAMVPHGAGGMSSGRANHWTRSRSASLRSLYLRLRSPSASPYRIQRMRAPLLTSRRPPYGCGFKSPQYHEAVPTVLRVRGYQFFFYMADRYEPPHIHVQKEDDAAKLWLDPLEFAYVEGFRRHECNEILRISQRHRRQLLSARYNHFGSLDDE